MADSLGFLHPAEADAPIEEAEVVELFDIVGSLLAVSGVCCAQWVDSLLPTNTKSDASFVEPHLTTYSYVDTCLRTCLCSIWGSV